MTQLLCEVVPIQLETHPDADSLSIVRVDDYTCVVRTADWQGINAGVYIPFDSVVPDRPEYAFLDGHRRIRARKFRGVFSQGLLMPVPPEVAAYCIGDNMADVMGITKYEPPEPMSMGGEDERDPSPAAYEIPRYTDIEHLRKYQRLFAPGEMVAVHEKVHGANFRAVMVDGTLHIGSHTRWKKENPDVAWWKVATPEFRAFMERYAPENRVVFGEVYGSVQNLKYAHRPGYVSLAIFDVWNAHSGTYLDYSELAEIQNASFGLSMDPAPLLGVIPFDFSVIEDMAERDSRLCTGQLMEGVVVRPMHERYDHRVGRVILKLHSKRYLLDKGT